MRWERAELPETAASAAVQGSMFRKIENTRVSQVAQNTFLYFRQRLYREVSLRLSDCPYTTSKPVQRQEERTSVGVCV